MITLKGDLADNYEPDDASVDRMAEAAQAAMQRVAVPDVTTASEVLSASFDLLDRMLTAVRECQEPKHRFANAKIIATALNGMLATHGKVPN